MLDMSGANGSIFGAGFFHDIKLFGRLILAMTFKETTYRGPFWKTLIKTAFTNFRAIKPVMMMLALYVHLGPFSRFVVAQIDKQIADIEKGNWEQPALVAAE